MLKAMVSVMNPNKEFEIFKGVKMPNKKRKITARKKETKPQVNKESHVMKSINQWLSLLPTVIWFERLNSGKVLSAYSGRWMQLCRKGTPDYISLVNDGAVVHVLFIEAKREGGKQTSEQKEFEAGITGFINVHYIVANNASDVTSKINNISVKEFTHD